MQGSKHIGNLVRHQGGEVGQHLADLHHRAPHVSHGGQDFRGCRGVGLVQQPLLLVGRDEIFA